MKRKPNPLVDWPQPSTKKPKPRKKRRRQLSDLTHKQSAALLSGERFTRAELQKLIKGKYLRLHEIAAVKRRGQFRAAEVDTLIRGTVKSKLERRQEIKDSNYKDYVRRMRPYFGNEFTAASGFDLRSAKKWTPAQKAKVTKYFRIVAPRLTGEFVVKRYRRKDHLRAAIAETQQESFLKGQTAALFSIDPGDDVEVHFAKGRALIRRRGLDEDALLFDKAAFLEDPETEIDRVLSLTDASVFRIITGGNVGLQALGRDALRLMLIHYVNEYAVDDKDRRDRFDAQHYDEWLNGIIAYGGVERKVRPKIQRQIDKHVKIVAARRAQHNRDRAKRAKKYTRRQLLKGR